MQRAIGLSRGGSSATVHPTLGGALSSWTCHGRAVLRAAQAGAAGPLQMACFALVPYANRIRDGRFACGGRSYCLPPNMPGFAHPLHGTGWLEVWEVEACDEHAVTLSLRHDADQHWPWDFEARQSIAVEEGSLAITLALKNRSLARMPAGLGLHPYFRRPANSRIAFAAEGVWLSDEDMLPRRLAAPGDVADFSRPAAPPADRLIDNCYAGWDGRVTISSPEGRVMLAAHGASFLHVYAPPGEDFICLEPVTHMPDAVNRHKVPASGARSLDPGESCELALEMRVETAGAESRYADGGIHRD